MKNRTITLLCAAIIAAAQISGQLLNVARA